jgi:hypothetical protein
MRAERREARRLFAPMTVSDAEWAILEAPLLAAKQRGHRRRARRWPAGRDDTAQPPAAVEGYANSKLGIGYTSDNWSGSCSGSTSRTCTFTVNQSMALTVVFVDHNGG